MYFRKAVAIDISKIDAIRHFSHGDQRDKPLRCPINCFIGVLSQNQRKK